MKHRYLFLLGALALAGFQTMSAQNATPAAAQDSQTPPAAAPAPAPTPSPWTKHGVDFYLLGDVYGDLNFNHPDSGVNGLYNFNVRADQVHLSFAKFAMEKASGVLGFRVDVGGGQTVHIVGGADDAPENFRYLEQMYVEFRPPKTHGMEVDFGKFVTTAGAEVIESNANWNYSRSLLFAWAIPYYHFGMRATIPVTKTFSTGLQLVNGWNSLGTNNTFETVGLVGNFTFKKVTWTNVYYTGPQEVAGVHDYRQLYDTNFVITPSDKSSIYVNFDYGTDKAPGAGASRANWTGIAFAGRYQLTKLFAFAPRFEVFNDMDGFSTGVAQYYKEITLTGEMKIHDGIITRLEYRRDMADEPYFDRGAQTAVAKNQSTLTLALIAFFGPKK